MLEVRSRSSEEFDLRCGLVIGSRKVAVVYKAIIIEGWNSHR